MVQKKLETFPRPPGDNGRGVHWCPQEGVWGRTDWLKWQKRILEMDIKWVKLIIPTSYEADAVVKRLVEIDVMPVCRFMRKNSASHNSNELDDPPPNIFAKIAQLVELGAVYFELNNEPDDADRAWVGSQPDGWEAMVVREFIRSARKVQQVGGLPAFPAFNPDHGEARNALQILLDEPGGRAVVDAGIWIALHNYALGRPFNYPNDPIRMFGRPLTEEVWLNQGQPSFWTNVDLKEKVWHRQSLAKINQLRAEKQNKNVTILTDHTCFRDYEYWRHVVTEVAGLEPIPMMMTEGGWVIRDTPNDLIYPELTAVTASQLNLKMFQFIQGDIDMTIHKPDETIETVSAPDYLLALMPWHIGQTAFGAGTGRDWEKQAWITHDFDQEYDLNGELPIIQMLRDLPSKVRIANDRTPQVWKDVQAKYAQLQPEPVTYWDHRFKYLGQGVGAKQVAGADIAWDVVEGYWQDVGELNPSEPLTPGYIMVRVLDKDNVPISGAKVEIRRSDATDFIETKAPIDRYLGNYAMHGRLGTYTIKVLHQGHPSAEVYGLGLGREDPDSGWDLTSFFFVFKLRT